MEVLTWLTFDKGENRQDIEQSEEHGQERTNTAYLFAVTFFMLSIDKIKYVFFKDSTRFAACFGGRVHTISKNQGEPRLFLNQ